ncbi:MAG: transcriptional regulator, SARP family protein, partial [Umezawaea sp.]
MPLAVLTDSESRALLARHLGAARMTAEPEAVDDVVRHCAGLPLALGIVAARATIRPDLDLVAQAAALRDHRTRLDALDTGDTDLNLRAVLSWSCRALTPPAARLFDLLGLAPGPDVSTAAAAALLGVDPTGPLAELEANHLVAQPEPGRYRMHDLVRLYATEQASQQEAALRRVVDFYLHTAHAADRATLVLSTLMGRGWIVVGLVGLLPSILHGELAPGSLAL